jgi:DUF971 family protein
MSHQPIQFGDEPGVGSGQVIDPADQNARPVSIDLKKDDGVTIVWNDGRTSSYPVRYLRRMSPSAEAKQLRDQMAANPLTVLPGRATDAGEEPFTATGAELVGNYALRLRFSDGHDTGIYSWPYLRRIDPAHAGGADGPGRGAKNGTEPDGPSDMDPDRLIRP